MRKSSILLLLTAGALVSCARREIPKQAETPKPAEPQPAAEVTFAKGDVKAFSHGAWLDVFIGQKLLASDSLDVRVKSECELKNIAGRIVKLSGVRKDAVAPLLEKSITEKPKPAAKALAAIKKLEAKQSAQIATPTAVAGVRGTKSRQQSPDTAHKDSSSHK
ncbi:MAG: hypothetical protein QME74_05095 [Candidatus Edwardsbacteria bacterium]|nr:hypothetical protein [Candidatus Edwardsbacteria bacterium]